MRLKNIRNRHSGVSYNEALVAAFLIAVLLLPALEGLQLGVIGSGIHRQSSQAHQLAQQKMEEILQTSFSTLENAAAGQNTATILSDSVLLDNGQSLERQVFISDYDADNQDADNNVFTGGDTGVLWIKIALTDGTTTLETLLSE